MELATFAYDDGYPEAIIRGLRSSFLNDMQYQQMKNCTTLAELKTFLEDTDYAPFLQNENADIAITTLRNKLREKLAGEIQYIQAQSVGELFEFLSLMKHKYMIENVVNIIEQLRADPRANITGIHPLGIFEGIDNIKVEGDDLTSLYKNVLIDTPIGTYFMKFLEEQLEALGDNRNLQEVQNLFKEMKPENIRSSLKKLWLEDFYEFCETKLNLTSQDMLCSILNIEADFKNIQVCYNTIGPSANQQKVTLLRAQLSPSFGYLYPDSDDAIKKATTIEALKEAIKGCENYKDLLKDAPDPSKLDEQTFATKTLEDIMTEDECRRYSLAFDQAAQHAVFYAYVKLKELEIRNIIWLAEMITRKLQKGHNGWKKIIVPFAPLTEQK